MKHKLKAIVKGAALGALLIAAASILWGCESMPPVTVIGQDGDYSYSPKSGMIITPRFQRIIIHPTNK